MSLFCIWHRRIARECVARRRGGTNTTSLARALDEHAINNPVLFYRRDGGWEVVQHFFVEEELVDLDTHVDGDLVLL